MPLLERYRALVLQKALKPDGEQLAAAQKLDGLARALKILQTRRVVAL